MGKSRGPPRGTPASVRAPKPPFLSTSTTGQLEALNRWWASRDSLPGWVAPASGLEANDDVRDLQLPLLLQVGSTAPKEDLLWPLWYRLLSISRALI